MTYAISWDKVVTQISNLPFHQLEILLLALGVARLNRLTHYKAPCGWQVKMVMAVFPKPSVPTNHSVFNPSILQCCFLQMFYPPS